MLHGLVSGWSRKVKQEECLRALENVARLEQHEVLRHGPSGAGGLKAGGARTIGHSVLILIVVNKIIADGIESIPACWQNIGFVPMIILLIFVVCVSGLSVLLMTKSMALIPGNQDLSHRFEYMNVVEAFLPPIHQIVVRFCFIYVLLYSTLDLKQLTDVVDTLFFAPLFGRRVFFNFDPTASPRRWHSASTWGPAFDSQLTHGVLHHSEMPSNISLLDRLHLPAYLEEVLTYLPSFEDAPTVSISPSYVGLLALIVFLSQYNLEENQWISVATFSLSALIWPLVFFISLVKVVYEFAPILIGLVTEHVARRAFFAGTVPRLIKRGLVRNYYAVRLARYLWRKLQPKSESIVMVVGRWAYRALRYSLFRLVAAVPMQRMRTWAGHKLNTRSEPLLSWGSQTSKMKKLLTTLLVARTAREASIEEVDRMAAKWHSVVQHVPGVANWIDLDLTQVLQVHRNSPELPALPASGYSSVTLGSEWLSQLERETMPRTVTFPEGSKSLFNSEYEVVRDALKSSTCGQCYSDLCFDAAWESNMLQCPAAVKIKTLEAVVYSEVSYNAYSIMFHQRPQMPSLYGLKGGWLSVLTALAKVFTLTEIVPSISNEVRKEVNLTNTCWWAIILSAVVASVFSLIIAVGFPRTNQIHPVSLVFERLLPPIAGNFIILLYNMIVGIPNLAMNLVTLRYNLVNTGLLSNRQALTFVAAGPLLVYLLASLLPDDLGDAVDSLCCLAIGYWVPLWVYVLAMRQSPLALRDEVRKDMLRLSISAFKPAHGTLAEVQNLLRKWARYAGHKDAQLRVLLKMDQPDERRDYVASKGVIDRPLRRSLSPNARSTSLSLSSKSSASLPSSGPAICRDRSAGSSDSEYPTSSVFSDAMYMSAHWRAQCESRHEARQRAALHSNDGDSSDSSSNHDAFKMLLTRDSLRRRATLEDDSIDSLEDWKTLYPVADLIAHHQRSDVRIERKIRFVNSDEEEALALRPKLKSARIRSADSVSPVHDEGEVPANHKFLIRGPSIFKSSLHRHKPISEEKDENDSTTYIPSRSKTRSKTLARERRRKSVWRKPGKLNESDSIPSAGRLKSRNKTHASNSYMTVMQSKTTSISDMSSSLVANSYSGTLTETDPSTYQFYERKRDRLTTDWRPGTLTSSLSNSSVAWNMSQSCDTDATAGFVSESSSSCDSSRPPTPPIYLELSRETLKSLGTVNSKVQALCNFTPPTKMRTASPARSVAAINTDSTRDVTPWANYLYNSPYALRKHISFTLTPASKVKKLTTRSLNLSTLWTSSRALQDRRYSRSNQLALIKQKIILAERPQRFVTKSYFVWLTYVALKLQSKTLTAYRRDQDAGYKTVDATPTSVLSSLSSWGAGRRRLPTRPRNRLSSNASLVGFAPPVTMSVRTVSCQFVSWCRHQWTDFRCFTLATDSCSPVLLNAVMRLPRSTKYATIEISAAQDVLMEKLREARCCPLRSSLIPLALKEQPMLQITYRHWSMRLMLLLIRVITASVFVLPGALHCMVLMAKGCRQGFSVLNKAIERLLLPPQTGLTHSAFISQTSEDVSSPTTVIGGTDDVGLSSNKSVDSLAELLMMSDSESFSSSSPESDAGPIVARSSWFRRNTPMVEKQRARNHMNRMELTPVTVGDQQATIGLFALMMAVMLPLAVVVDWWCSGVSWGAPSQYWLLPANLHRAFVQYTDVHWLHTWAFWVGSETTAPFWTHHLTMR